MSGPISYNMGEIQAVAQEIDAYAATVEESVRELRQGVAELFDSWQGEESDAFAENQETWAAAAADLKATLSRLSAQLRLAAKRMAATDERVAKGF